MSGDGGAKLREPFEKLLLAFVGGLSLAALGLPPAVAFEARPGGCLLVLQLTAEVAPLGGGERAVEVVTLDAGQPSLGLVQLLLGQYVTYDGEDGPFDDPAETRITGTLDGEPIELSKLSWRLGEDGSVVIQTSEGTFTAVPEDSDDTHTEALRRYLDKHPFSRDDP